MRAGEILPGHANNCQEGTKPTGGNGSRRHHMRFWNTKAKSNAAHCSQPRFFGCPLPSVKTVKIIHTHVKELARPVGNHGHQSQGRGIFSTLI